MSCCVALNTMCVSVANIFCSESIHMQTSYSINILGFIRKVTAINVYNNNNNNNLFIYIALFTCNNRFYKGIRYACDVSQVNFTSKQYY